MGNNQRKAKRKNREERVSVNERRELWFQKKNNIGEENVGEEM